MLSTCIDKMVQYGEMEMMKKNEKTLFEAGKYLEVLKVFEAKEKKPNKYKIGALVFLGRETEARVLSEALLEGVNEAVEIHFLLLLSSVRRQDFERMKRDLRLLYASFQKSRGKRERFFVHQGLGIISFYRGEFLRCCEHSQKAFRIALHLDDPYLCMLSNDLLGHAYCMREQYSLGLRHFEDSSRFSQKISNDSNHQVIALAKIAYRIEAGWELKDTTTDLKNWMETISPQDFFSRTRAMLMRSKLLQLKGDFKRAEDSLLEVSRHVYEFNHARQILDYNLLMSQFSLLINQPERALALVRTSLHLCQKGRDFYSSLRFQELENTIQKDTHVELSLAHLAEKTGINPRMKFPLGIIPEQDIEKLLGRVKIKKGLPSDVVYHLEKEEKLGLLLLSKIYPYQNFIDDRLPERDMLLFFQGQIKVLRHLSALQYELLKLLLTRKLWSRKDLVETFWQTPYDSFIHDNKLYVTLQRLKKRLGLSLFHFEKGSLHVASVKIYTDQREYFSEKMDTELWDDSELNIRQRQFLKSVPKGSLIRPTDYKDKFKVSRNTCSRDLSALVKSNFLVKRGKGAGTYYQVI